MKINKLISIAINNIRIVVCINNTLYYYISVWIESAYQGCYCVELNYANIPFQREKVYPLYYKNEPVGAYIADLVVADCIILELKSVKQLSSVMEAQIINYLKLANLPIGYLINFKNLRVEWKRFINKRE